MTNTAIWPLRLPVRASRTAAVVAISIVAIALFALAFAVGRWTDSGSSTPQRSPQLVVPVGPLPPPGIDCRTPQGFC
jgi:hypothetical protein